MRGLGFRVWGLGIRVWGVPQSVGLSQVHAENKGSGQLTSPPRNPGPGNSSSG